MSKEIENFLWCQSGSPVDRNWFVIDEHVSKYCQSEEQNAAMSFMTSSRLKRKAKHKQGTSTSTGYEIKESNTAIQLSGNFYEVDESGRPLVFMFTTKNKDYKKAIDCLSKYASLIGLTLRKEDLKAYEQFFISKKRKRHIALTISIIAFLIICLISLCITKNNASQEKTNYNEYRSTL